MADRYNMGRKTTIQLQRTAPTVYNNFPRSVFWMGIAQTICGATVLTVGGVGMVLCTTSARMALAGGVDFAVWVILAGSFGIAAGRMKTTCEIVSSTILSILASVFSICLAILSGFTLHFLLTISSTRSYINEYESSISNPIKKYDIPTCAFLLFVSIIETITSITMSVFGCHFSCFCCRNCCCRYDMTTTETGIVFEGEAQQLLQPVVCNNTAAAATTDVVISQHPPMYQPTLPAATAAVTGNNVWLQSQYTKLDDEMLTA